MKNEKKEQEKADKANEAKKKLAEDVIKALLTASITCAAFLQSEQATSSLAPGSLQPLKADVDNMTEALDAAKACKRGALDVEVMTLKEAKKLVRDAKQKEGLLKATIENLRRVAGE